MKQIQYIVVHVKFHVFQGFRQFFDFITGFDFQFTERMMDAGQVFIPVIPGCGIRQQFDRFDEHSIHNAGIDDNQNHRQYDKRA